MNDFISRESAVKAITEYKVKIESENMPEITKCCFQMLNITCDKNIGFINSIPAADVQPVKRGKWKRVALILNRSVCSNCSWRTDEIDTFDFNFCPNCGADMRENQAKQ